MKVARRFHGTVGFDLYESFIEIKFMYPTVNT